MKNKAAAPGTVLAAQLRAKNDWRRRQARLPFARKVEIVICLQKLAVEIGAVMGRKPVGMVWRLPSGKYEDHAAGAAGKGKRPTIAFKRKAGASPA